MDGQHWQQKNSLTKDLPLRRRSLSWLKLILAAQAILSLDARLSFSRAADTPSESAIKSFDMTGTWAHDCGPTTTANPAQKILGVGTGNLKFAAFYTTVANDYSNFVIAFDIESASVTPDNDLQLVMRKYTEFVVQTFRKSGTSIRLWDAYISAAVTGAPSKILVAGGSNATGASQPGEPTPALQRCAP